MCIHSNGLVGQCIDVVESLRWCITVGHTTFPDSFQDQRSSRSLIQVVQNGEGGIRTHGAREDTLVFKTRAINHSTTSPEGVRCPAGHLTTVSGRAPSSVFRLGQRQQTLIGITSGRARFGQLALVVTLQCFEEITADATLHHSRLQLLVGGCIDRLKGQAGEGGIGIEPGQQGC